MSPSLMSPFLRLRSIQLAGPCLAILTACQAGPPSTAPRGPSATAAVTRDTAAVEIASARCDHEAACGAVGTGRTYAAPDECASELFRSAREDLAAAPCGV